MYFGIDFHDTYKTIIEDEIDERKKVNKRMEKEWNNQNDKTMKWKLICIFMAWKDTIHSNDTPTLGNLTIFKVKHKTFSKKNKTKQRKLKQKKNYIHINI